MVVIPNRRKTFSHSVIQRISYDLVNVHLLILTRPKMSTDVRMPNTIPVSLRKLSTLLLGYRKVVKIQTWLLLVGMYPLRLLHPDLPPFTILLRAVLRLTNHQHQHHRRMHQQQTHLEQTHLRIQQTRQHLISLYRQTHQHQHLPLSSIIQRRAVLRLNQFKPTHRHLPSIIPVEKMVPHLFWIIFVKWGISVWPVKHLQRLANLIYLVELLYRRRMLSLRYLHPSTMQCWQRDTRPTILSKRWM
mmetsp:Transcript_40253/g.45369  ORF Transcript_40253/g.45369 Transcript_40253/m.45369 type:complete len:245 (-) Transcript_40253:432-1166(-)